MDGMRGQTPDLMRRDNALDAEDRGIDILADRGAILKQETCQWIDNGQQGPLAFPEYGLDDYGRTPDGQLSYDNPLVDVQLVMGHVPLDITTALEDSELQSNLLAKIGGWELGMDD